jgi:large subunit ribosomal protein L25
MEELLFNAEIREGSGTGAARKTRGEGFIPGVLNGAGHKPCQIKLERKSTERIITHLESHNVMASLVLKGSGGEEKIRTVIKEIQMQPIKGNVLHLDFYRIRMDKPIRMQIPIHLTGDAPGLEKGGIMEHELRELEVQALPDRIPEMAEIDVSSMEIGDTFIVSDIKLADDVEIIDLPEKMIISIMAPKVVEEETEEEAAEEEVVAETAEGETAEPEVISHQKAEERRKEKEKQSKE